MFTQKRNLQLVYTLAMLVISAGLSSCGNRSSADGDSTGDRSSASGVPLVQTAKAAVGTTPDVSTLGSSALDGGTVTPPVPQTTLTVCVPLIDAPPGTVNLCPPVPPAPKNLVNTSFKTFCSNNGYIRSLSTGNGQNGKKNGQAGGNNYPPGAYLEDPSQVNPTLFAEVGGTIVDSRPIPDTFRTGTHPVIALNFGATPKTATIKVSAGFDTDGNKKIDPGERLIGQPFVGTLAQWEANPQLTINLGQRTNYGGQKSNVDTQACDTGHSPLVLALDGNKIKLSGPKNSGVVFDIVGDGEAYPTGWIDGSNTVFLARDLNGNGRIDDGSELFGEGTVLGNGHRARDGFDAARELDSNGDGILSPVDAKWNELVVWDGVIPANPSVRENLRSLSLMGISSINLNAIAVNEVDRYGNRTGLRSTFTQAERNGREILSTIVDIWFLQIIP